jgi:nucleotide-binding universal stress UspA family protein
VVVVGVDGSDQSLVALRWAAEYTRLTSATLRAVTAWHCPTTYGIAPDWTDMDFVAEARDQLEASLTQALGDSPGIPLETSVVEGQSAPVLLEAARDADLLVVGSHGHGRFAGMLMGSVSTHCVEHASCPVVVVRGDARVTAAGGSHRQAEPRARSTEQAPTSATAST